MCFVGIEMACKNVHQWKKRMYIFNSITNKHNNNVNGQPSAMDKGQISLIKQVGYGIDF
jgi:hypothetical protein